MHIQKLGRSLSYAARSQNRYLTANLSNYRMGPRTLPFYMTVVQNDGISQKELMKHLQTDKTRTTKAVNHLVEAGYVRRECRREDHRINGVFITTKGKAVLPEVRKVLDRLDGLLTDELSEQDIDRFIFMLEAFGDAVDRNLGDENGR